MGKTRVLVVDDTIVVRRLLSEVINRDPDLEVVGTAPNGKVALMKLPQLNPDIITLDIEMPTLDGLETLKEIRKTDRTTPIIMLSSLTRTGAEQTFEALSSGATDYLLKPGNLTDFDKAIAELSSLLLPKIKAHCVKTPIEPLKISDSRKPAGSQRIDCLGIGTSTGGPNALETLFHRFQRKLPVPTFIVQHMPPVFTKTLAERLDKISPNRVFEGSDGQVAENGCAYIAPGGKHMEVRKIEGEMRIHLHEGPPENSCRPAVDTLFKSIAKSYGQNSLGVILTGMGQDGLRGCEAISEVNGSVYSQDQETSLIWGMPRAIVEADLAEKILALNDLPEQIYTRLAIGHSVMV